jgi:DNA-binding transcriptional MerR regulator
MNENETPTNEDKTPPSDDPTTEPKASGDSEYFRKWYDANGKALNRKRKRKYHSDPGYKEKVLAQNRAARKRKREVAQAQRKQSGGTERTIVERSWKTRPMTVTLDSGEQAAVQGFTIGAVAKILGCSVQGLRLWERNGVLPGTPYRHQNRDRLYPWDLIDLYQEILLKTKRLDPDKPRPRPLWMTRQVVQFSDGRTAETPLFRIGVLARAARKTVVTLEQWEGRLIPRTPFRAAGDPGYRLFTLEQIRAVVSALQKRDWEVRGEQAQAALLSEVTEAWSALGVIGATIVKRKSTDAPTTPD